MQQRRLRLGDILDDYCPRERRITNHAVVAMIDDQVKQTRCTTCDADHEYKHAKVPPPRRKKDSVIVASPEEIAPAEPVDGGVEPVETTETVEAAHTSAEAGETGETGETTETGETGETTETTETGETEGADVAAGPAEEEGPVHRRLIRATLPRPEGQAPERKAPEFTIRQSGGRGREFDGNTAGGGGQRHGRGGRRGMRGPQQGPSGGQPPRFGGPRQGNQSRHGSAPQDQRPGGNRPPRGPRQGSGPGRKRGR
jgi:hypothetical protein